MADGLTTLNSLLWGTSTGGAAGSGETFLAMGADRVDTRTPPDTTRVWGLQLNQVKNLATAMSASFKGGTRLQVLPQNSNPFGSTEAGFYIDTTGVPRVSYLGSLLPLLVGAAGVPSIAVGSAAQLGTSPSAAVVSGTDFGGTLSFTSGTSTSAFVANTAITIATVTFSATRPAIPSSIVIVPANDKAALATSGSTDIVFYVDQSSTTTGLFVVKAICSGTGTLTASTAFKLAFSTVQ